MRGGATFCARCGTWRELFKPCACRDTPRIASNLESVIAIAAATARARIASGTGPLEVTAAEMEEASAITRSPVEA